MHFATKVTGLRWTPTVEAAIEQLAIYQAHGNVVIEMRRPKSEKINMTLHADCLVMPLDVAFSLAAAPDGACMTIARHGSTKTWWRSKSRRGPAESFASEQWWRRCRRPRSSPRRRCQPLSSNRRARLCWRKFSIRRTSWTEFKMETAEMIYAYELFTVDYDVPER